MADLSTVEQALVDSMTPFLYPLGTGQPSITGHLIKRGRGWPDAAGLQEDLAAGTARVTVYSLAGTKNTSRSLRGWFGGNPNALTLGVTASGNTATFSGVAGPGQLAFVQARGIGFGLVPTATQAPADIAAALAAKINLDGELEATATGPALSVTFAGTPEPVQATLSALTPTWKEVRRQEQLIRASVWANSYAQRDQISQALDAGFADLRFFNVGDPYPAWIEYHDTTSLDSSETASLYRRDLVFKVEYGTYVQSVGAALQMVIGRLAADGAIVRFGGQTASTGVLLDSSGNVYSDSAGQLADQPST